MTHCLSKCLLPLSETGLYYIKKGIQYFFFIEKNKRLKIKLSTPAIPVPSSRHFVKGFHVVISTEGVTLHAKFFKLISYPLILPGSHHPRTVHVVLVTRVAGVLNDHSRGVGGVKADLKLTIRPDRACVASPRYPHKLKYVSPAGFFTTGDLEA